MADIYKVVEAGNLLRQADGLLITAGAGIGIDSGLPDFRGNSGFWKAYPAFTHAGISFSDIANSAAFVHMPRQAWGFYGHRLQLYRDTVPHVGFDILRQIATRMQHGAFVFTSNVDGQFQKAGFDESRIVECHGSIHYLQCCTPCYSGIWPASEVKPDVDMDSCLLRSKLIFCPYCDELARPNILMFDDWRWLSQRADLQAARLSMWLTKVVNPVVLEIGAGIDIPTVRHKGESLDIPLIRINPTNAKISRESHIGLEMNALEALRLLQVTLDE